MSVNSNAANSCQSGRHLTSTHICVMNAEAGKTIILRGKEVKISDELMSRLWSKVDKVSNQNGCWIWTRSKSKKGYGQFGIGRNQFLVHRILLTLKESRCIDGFLACHHCDNPSCVNPDHLWVGTTQENTLDMLKKGRSLKGEDHPMRTLNKDFVIKIRLLYEGGGHSHSTLAKMFSICPATIGKILRRERWKHV